MPVYLDCAATTPLDPRVYAEMRRYYEDDFGNAGSRTHEFGRRARAAVERARDRIAAVAGGARSDVIFTSGATESNNLAILGLASSVSAVGAGLSHARRGDPPISGPDRTHGGDPPVSDSVKRHIVSTQIEHHAVLEPLTELRRRGFDVTLVAPREHGAIDVDDIRTALRPETLLVSVMHVNNETGVIQPIEDVADLLAGHDAAFHVDAAQSFARLIEPLRHPRIDLISASAHKINGPKGVGALVIRRREGRRPTLQPLMFGGGQERALRPGTTPVPLVAGFGLAAELAEEESAARDARCRAFRQSLLDGLAPLEPVINGDVARSVPYIINLSFPGLEAEAAIDAWKDLVAISNGAACTTQSYTCSHVLAAMKVSGWRADGALRFSWGGETVEPDWRALVAAAAPYRQAIAPLP